MTGPYWCQGTRIAVVTGQNAPLSERYVAEVAARSIRERGVESAVFVGVDSITGSWDLTLYLGTSAAHPWLADRFRERDRLRFTSPLRRGAEASLGMTFRYEGANCAGIVAE
ncbi:MAG TPA: hypothetical protein ENN56_02000, partial [Firmicutes bacterium]|nr:hypothetical protein [Bacillota bacterium]